MKRLLPALFALLPSVAVAQVYQTHLQKVFDPLSESNMRAVVQTADGGYAYAGTHPITVLASGRGRPLLSKLDPAFALTWAQTYVTPIELADPAAIGPELTAHDMIQTADGGYILVGRSIDEQAGQTQGFLLRTDGQGDVAWFRQYPGVRELTSVAEAADGFVAVGANPADHAVLMATEADGRPRCGQEVWTVKGRDPGTAHYAEVIPYLGSFAAVGATGITLWDSDVLVTVFDDTCKITLNRAYGDTLFYDADGVAIGLSEAGESIAWDEKANRLVITGNHRATCIGVCVPALWDDILAFQIDKAGAVQWARRFDVQGREDRGLDVTVGRGLGLRTRNAQIWITGGAQSDHLAAGVTSDDAFLLQLDRLSGALQSFEVFGDQAFDTTYAVLANTDANVVLLGDSDSFNPAHADTYLIERFANVLGVCRDLPIVPAVEPVNLPIVKPIQKALAPPSTTPDLVAVPAPVGDRTLCPKRQVR